MQKPQVGQVLVTKTGQQFRVEQVTCTHDPDDPLSSPDEFMVSLQPMQGLHPVDLDWETDDLFGDEFEAWCQRNGVSY